MASSQKGEVMTRNRLLDRREFTAEAVLAALSGVAITISGCGGGGGYSSPSSPSAPSASSPAASSGPGDKTGTISNNHGHAAVVTAAQVVAASAVQLDIRGAADHTHTVVLGADAVQAIKTGQTVRADSTSTGGHAHTVTFNCDASEPASPY
jgi:hypothetical protein